MDHSDPTTGNTPSPPTFYPWHRLPSELQLMVLDTVLRMARPITFKTHSVHLVRALASLTYTSKKMRSLSLQSYYSSGIRIQWTRSTPYRHETDINYPWILALPSLDARLFVYQIVIDLEVDHRLEYNTNCPAQDPKEAIHMGLIQWFLLFRPKCDVSTNTGIANQKYTNWQLTFPNLKSLDVIVCFVEFLESGGPAECMNSGRYYDRIPRSHPFFRASETARVLLTPEIFNVEVRGFSCDGYEEGGRVAGVTCPYRCSARVIEVIEDVFERSKME